MSRTGSLVQEQISALLKNLLFIFAISCFLPLIINGEIFPFLSHDHLKI